MSQLAAWTKTLTSRWSSSVLLMAVGVLVAVSAAIVVYVWGAGVSTDHDHDWRRVACDVWTGEAGRRWEERGWPPAVAVRARGPPA